MFCDMEGFTQMVERLGSESAFNIMNKIYDILIQCVYQYEGTVNEMTGDGIIALFGAPVALEDALQKAILASISIHSKTSEIQSLENIFMPIKMRIGLHTGPVIVGTLGNNFRVDFKAVGDTVILASRLETMAEPGTTYVTEKIFELTQNLFRFEALGKRQVKGISQQIPVFKLLSPKKETDYSHERYGRTIYSEMVGREKEINALESQVLKVINGKGSFVNIIGEAGIGKSRLLAELKKSSAVKKVTFIEGRSISIGRNLSFYPIIDILKQWAGIKEQDGEKTALAKIKTAIKEHCQDKIHDVLPFIATLMGMKLSGNYKERIDGIDGGALEKLIVKALRELLIKIAEKRALVIVIEDLHWVDLSSIGLMESLFRLATTHQILFINLFRSGYEETGDRIIKTIKEKFSPFYIEIKLTPLDERMSETIITNILKTGKLHYSVTEKIIRRTNGNPLFIEEVMRSFIDDGTLTMKDGTFALTQKAIAVPIPYTINDVLTARIDRLEEKTRMVVKNASVIGKNFLYKLLVDIVGLIDDLDDRLSYLSRAELVSKHKKLSEIEYFFNHALVQEVAYESILEKKRKELHLQVARSIEKYFSNKLHEYYGMLSYHYSKGGEETKTLKYLIKAGEESLKASASSEALHYYQEAVDLYKKKFGDTADPEQLAVLYKNIAFAHFNKGQHAHAIEWFDHALSIYGVTFPKGVMSITLRFIYSFFHFIVACYFPKLKFKKEPTAKEKDILMLCYTKLRALVFVNSLEFFLESIFIAPRMAKYDLTKINFGVALFSGASVTISFAGLSFKLSRKILRFCRDRVPQDNFKSILYLKMCELAHNCVAGNIDLNDYEDQLVEQNLSIGEFYTSALYIFHHGYRELLAGFHKDALQKVDRLSGISDTYEYDFARILKYELNSKIFIKTQRFHEALAEIDKAIDFTTKLEMYLYVQQFYSAKAYAQVIFEDISGAKESLSQAEKYIEQSKAYQSPYYYGNFLLGRFILDNYFLETAIKSDNKTQFFKMRKRTASSGRKLLKNATKVASDLPEALRLMGTYYWRIDKQRKALGYWYRSIQAGKKTDARIDLSRTYFELGKRLNEPKSKYNELNGIKKEAYLTKAQSIFEELGLQI